MRARRVRSLVATAAFMIAVTALPPACGASLRYATWAYNLARGGERVEVSRATYEFLTTSICVPRGSVDDLKRALDEELEWSYPSHILMVP